MIDPEVLQIIKANEADASALSGIALTAKRYWNYPEHYYDMWRDELTISTAYIKENIVYKAVYENSVIGFYSIIENESDSYVQEVLVKKGFWLEHIFILPNYHKLGIGTALIDHAKQIARTKGFDQLFIFSDPMAKGFYFKVGAEFVEDSKSTIPGRLIPLFVLKIN